MDIAKQLITIVSILVKALGKCWAVNSLLTGLGLWYASSAAGVDANTILVVGVIWLVLSSGGACLGSLLVQAGEEVKRQQEERRREDEPPPTRESA